MDRAIRKITLIRSPTVIPVGTITGYQGIPPLGLAYIAGSLKSHGLKVTCIDPLGESPNRYSPWRDGLLFNGLTIEQILNRIPPDSDMVGLSCMFSNEWSASLELIRRTRALLPRAFIVVGGEHATADYDAILNESQADACVIGEGESKILALVDHLNGLDRDLTGVVFKDGHARQPEREKAPPTRIQEIDRIPRPAWEEFKLENYLSRGLGFSMQGKRSMPILASRGCPYRCSFCSSPRMWTTKWAPRDPDDLIDEMRFYIQKYRIEHFDFFDLTAIVNQEWTVSFCKKLISERLNVTWALPSGTRSEALTLEVLKMLRQAGLIKIAYSPESGSPRVLKNIQKRIKLGNLVRSMRNAVRSGLVAKANMVACFPDETWRDIFLDFVLITKLALAGVHDVAYFGFAPYPGSEYFERLLSEGKIVRDAGYNKFLEKNVFSSPVDMRSWSEHIPSRYASSITLGGMAYFYCLQYACRPWRSFISLYRILNNTPLTMLELALTGMLKDLLIRGKYSRTQTRNSRSETHRGPSYSESLSSFPDSS
jgi:anaerobic magnesium-protoporphyrin IX monomethyl ester cyclase